MLVTVINNNFSRVKGLMRDNEFCHTRLYSHKGIKLNCHSFTKNFVQCHAKNNKMHDLWSIPD